MDTQLTTSQQNRLHELETVIERGQQTFIEVGNALAEIRDSRLYRETHATFQKYCQQTWSWSRDAAYKLIRAASVASNVDRGLQKPTSERQVRPLTRLKSKDEQYEAWIKANEIADKEGCVVTGEIVAKAVEQIKPKPTKTEPIKPKRIVSVSPAVAESHADKAISWLLEVDLTKPGARKAIQKVVDFCNELLRGLDNE